MEHIITNNLMSHASDNNILYPLQHGFWSKLSCETQLIEFTHDTVSNMQDGAQTDVTVMDFSKAFDKVSHQRLVQKLHHYGIHGLTNNWINSFLLNRSEQVIVEGTPSARVWVKSGIPQGSILCPCFFLFYINDIPDNIQSSVRLFANGTIVYLALKPQSNTLILQDDLNKLAIWEEEMKNGIPAPITLLQEIERLSIMNISSMGTF